MAPRASHMVLRKGRSLQLFRRKREPCVEIKHLDIFDSGYRLSLCLGSSRVIQAAEENLQRSLRAKVDPRLSSIERHALRARAVACLDACGTDVI